MSVELVILSRLRSAPCGGRWVHGAVFGMELDGAPRWRAGVGSVLPYAGEPVDAWILCSAADLDAMLAGRVPSGRVGYRLGDRDGAPRLQQARATFALAALGWCGPWPDPAATPALDARMRAAAQDLAIGPADEVGALFAIGAPLGLDAVAWRATDDVRGRVVATAGLAGRDGAGLDCELLTRARRGADPREALRALRAAALFVAEVRPNGSIPAVLEVGDRRLELRAAPGFPEGMPLASAMVPVWEVGG